MLRHIAAHLQQAGDSCLMVLPEEGPARKAAEDAGLRVTVAATPVLRKADLNPRGLAAFGSCVRAWELGDGAFATS